MSPAFEDKMLTRKEAAYVFGKSASTMKRWCAEGAPFVGGVAPFSRLMAWILKREARNSERGKRTEGTKGSPDK
jgi:hypothetical protein